MQKGALRLEILCNNLSEIARLERKGIEEGFEKKEADLLKSLGEEVQLTLATEDNAQSPEYGVMGLVAKELKKTRFAQGYKEVMKRYRDSVNHPEGRMGFHTTTIRVADATQKNREPTRDAWLP